MKSVTDRHCSSRKSVTVTLDVEGSFYKGGIEQDQVRTVSPDSCVVRENGVWVIVCIICGVVHGLNINVGVVCFPKNRKGVRFKIMKI